jgi:hypothetical protein
MSAIESRQSNAHLRRLQGLLVLMLLWDVFALLAALSFGSALMKIDGDEIGGVLAARTSFSGPALVPIAVYFYGIVRNPLRHTGVLWVGVVEGCCSAVQPVSRHRKRHHAYRRLGDRRRFGRPAGVAPCQYAPR